jgi:hypothetical protein
MRVRIAVSTAYLAIMTMFLVPTEGWSQNQLGDAGLVPGVTVTVRYSWFRDPGTPGFWLETTGQVMSVSDQFVVLNVAANRRHVIRWGAITFIDFARP